MPENAAEHDDRQVLLLELDEENSPRLIALERPQLVDGADLGGVLLLQAQLWRIVTEGEVIETILIERPVEFVLQIAGEFLESADGA